MQVRRLATHVEVLAPAKLNLFLEVLGRRPDGFHEIETVMTPVSLYDTLTVSEDASGNIHLECETNVEEQGNAPRPENRVPEGSENLVVRALEALRRRSGTTLGARVRLTKRIPLAAGMAGGSTDAAAALAAANLAWGLHWSDAQLAEVAAELGSDVPFFFARRPALCRGRGERIEPLDDVEPLDFVVVAPPVGLSTAEVYRACRPADRPLEAQSLLDAWRRGDRAAVGRLLHNRLQEAAERLSPWIERLARAMDRTACLGHRMSGSGTSYFGLCRDARRARELAASPELRGLGRTFAVGGVAG